MTDNQFSSVGNVRQVKALAVPLIMFNIWRADFEYSIGKTVIEEDVEEFIQSALIEEANRSGTFKTEGLSPERLILEIEIDSIGANGPYYSEGFFMFFVFAYSWSQAEGAGPGSAYSRFHYRLKQDDKILLEDFVSNQATSEPIRKTHGTMGELRNFYSTNLVESLSLTFKNNIESIIENLDRFFSVSAEARNEN